MAREPRRSRFVVVEQVYYQQDGSQPLSVGHPYEQALTTDEQPYGPRRLVVGKEWQELDTGWIKHRASLVHLYNTEGTHFSVIPTQEELRALSLRVIQLGIWVPPPPALVGLWEGLVLPLSNCPPGSTLRHSPPEDQDLGLLRIRCLSNEATVMVTVFPP